jgi:hypothetical protein
MAAQPGIESYRFGKIVVDGQAHSQDLILLPERVLGGWWRREGHALHPEDLEAVLAARPAVLVVGLGALGRVRITDEARRAVEAAGIELIAEPTGQACETYNRLRGERATAAALHLTC